MRVLIVDDERLARSELRRLLGAHPEVTIAGEATNVGEAREAIDRLDPDVIFLDIEMPGGSGFDLLAGLDFVPAVVFTTAYDEHALRAFDVSAVDYLVKPIDPDRLGRALDRAAALPRPSESAGAESTVTRGHRVFVRDGDRCWFTPVERIVLIEAEDGYARVHFDGNKPLVARSLTAFENRLDPEMFFRANRAQIINLDAIRAIHPWFKGRLMVELEGGIEVTLSRRRTAAFQDRRGV